MHIAIAEAKAQFAEIIRRAEAGEAIVLTRYGRPVAQIAPAGPAASKSLIGAMAGQFSISDIHAGDAEAAALFKDSASQ